MPSDSTWAASLLQAEWDQHIALKVPFSERMSNVASTAGKIEFLHHLLEHPRVQTKPLRLLSANSQHFRRDIHPINSNALRQIVKQQATRATPHIQNRLPISNNQIAVEEAILPIR